MLVTWHAAYFTIISESLLQNLTQLLINPGFKNHLSKFYFDQPPAFLMYSFSKQCYVPVKACLIFPKGFILLPSEAA